MEKQEDEAVQLQEQSFSKQMRRATRNIHNISDALVNAKLAFALSDNSVWADGLLIFYEIFKYIEENAPVELLPRKFYRTDAFNRDLCYYLGSDWRESHTPRKEVVKYLQHLRKITDENPVLLMAYVYHLYMGLLSGGQILVKKRNLVNLNFLKNHESESNGSSIIDFHNEKIFELKKEMRYLVDEKAKYFDEKLKQRLIEESRIVFELNNSIIKTVKGVNRVGLQKFGILLIILLLAYLFAKLFIG